MNENDKYLVYIEICVQEDVCMLYTYLYDVMKKNTETLLRIKNSSIYFSEGVLRIGSGLLEKHFIVSQIGNRLPGIPRT